MLNRDAIMALIPHQDAMCLLDSAESWSDSGIICHAGSHLNAANPLRRAGRLSMLCGCEYGFQAAALHGALLARGRKQPPGYLVSLRIAHIAQFFLDDPAFGVLRVEATIEALTGAGLTYTFRLLSQSSAPLLAGRATIKLPPATQ